MSQESPNSSALVRRLRARHLELLAILATAPTIHAAASRMSLSQPALTRMVQEIEAMFGGPLFVRGSRGITPTHAGKVLVDRAVCLLGELDATAKVVQLVLAGRGGLLRVGTHTASQVASRAVARLMRDRPDLVVHFREGQINLLIDALLAGELDCIVGALPPDELRGERIDRLRLEQLDDDHAVAVTLRSSPWVRRRRLTWVDLQEARWVLPPKESLIRQAFVRACLASGHPAPQPAVEALSPVSTQSFITQEAAELGLLRADHAAELERQGILKVLKVTPELRLPATVLMSRREAHARPAVVDELLAWLLA